MIRINLLNPSYLKKGVAEISSSAGSAQIGWAGLGLTLAALAIGGGLFYFEGTKRAPQPKQPPAAPSPAAVPEQQAAPPAAPPPQPVAENKTKPGVIEARNLSVATQERGLLITLRASEGELRYRPSRLANPARLAVDVENCRLTVPAAQRSQAVEHASVRRVRLGQLQVDPPVCRIVLDLASWPRYEINPGPEGLRIQIWNDAK